MTDQTSSLGHVSPGGPAAVRELDEVVIHKLSVGPMDNNAYLLTCRASGAQLLVDAAAEAPRLLDLVRDGSPTARLDLVVTTHQHADHLGALASTVAVTGATTAAGTADVDAIESVAGIPVQRHLRDGDTVLVGQVTLAVVGLRGHTPGSVALVYREPATARAPGAVPGRAHVFTGDSLFPGGVGATGGDPARFAQLLGDVTTRLFDRFGDDTWVYPGHGDDTTLGAERPQLREWRERGW